MTNQYNPAGQNPYMPGPHNPGAPAQQQIAGQQSPQPNTPQRIRVTGLWVSRFPIQGKQFLRGIIGTDQSGSEQTFTLRTGDEVAILHNNRRSTENSPHANVVVTPREELDKIRGTDGQPQSGNLLDEYVGDTAPQTGVAPAAGAAPAANAAPAAAVHAAGTYGAQADGSSPAGPTAQPAQVHGGQPNPSHTQHNPPPAGHAGANHSPQPAQAHQATNPAHLAGNPATDPHHNPNPPGPDTPDDNLPF